MKAKWLTPFITAAFSPMAAQAADTTNYRYDALGRLVSTIDNSSAAGDQSTAITFDPAGDRSRYQSGPSSTSTPPLANSDSRCRTGCTESKPVGRVWNNDQHCTRDTCQFLIGHEHHQLHATQWWWLRGDRRGSAVRFRHGALNGGTGHVRTR